MHSHRAARWTLSGASGNICSLMPAKKKILPVDSRSTEPLTGPLQSRPMATKTVRAKQTNGAHVPPQNLDAEESVLGAMMLSPGAIAVVSEILSSDGREIYRESHAKIYRAALGLDVKGERSEEHTSELQS